MSTRDCTECQDRCAYEIFSLFNACSPRPAFLGLLSAFLGLLSSVFSLLSSVFSLLSSVYSPRPALLGLLSLACSPRPALLGLLSYPTPLFSFQYCFSIPFLGTTTYPILCIEYLASSVLQTNAVGTPSHRTIHRDSMKLTRVPHRQEPLSLSS